MNSPTGRGAQSEAGRKTKQAIEAACKALLGAERELTEMDRVTGDGDLGTSMERAAKAVQGAVGSYPLDDVPATLRAIGHTLRRELGGSSGPFYGVLFLRCGSVRRNREQRDWRSGLKRSIKAAARSVNWVARSLAIGPCWMRSIHS